MNKFLKTALAILPLAVMASCSDDDPTPDQNEGIVEKSETRYLRVNLRSADANPESRAPGDEGTYDKGDNDENLIKTVEFYFYDKDKRFHSYVPISTTGGNGAEQQAVEDATKPNISGFFHCNVPIELVQGETYPQYVICIINSVEGTAYQNKDMAAAQARRLSSPYGAASDPEQNLFLFGMSNSVYYGVDAYTSEPDQLIMATPFKLDALLTEDQITELESNPTELENHAINIYVERYAVKVKMDITDLNVKEYNSGDGKVKLVFKPTAWLVNAVEDDFFFLKAFRTETSAGNDGTEPGTANGMGDSYEKFVDLNGKLFPGWNNEAHHRSFWACSPGYYANKYPLVADDITDDKNEDYEVEYGNYKDAAEKNPISDFAVYQTYVLETTMKQDRLTGSEDLGNRYMPLASIPSVVLLGKYKIKGKEDDPDDIDFYAYGKTGNRYNFYIDDEQKTEITGLDNIIDKMLDDQTILLKKTGDKTYTSYTSSDIAKGTNLRRKIIIEHPSKDVRLAPTTAQSTQTNDITGIKVAADIVVLQINAAELTAADDDFYFYNAVAGEYQQVTKDNITTVNRLLLQNLGGAHLYKDGMAFFSAPIQHWGWYRSDNVNAQPKENADGTKTPKTINDWDWTAMRVGDFGLVRNHVYTLKIGEISGLGTGITDPEEPILPPADKVPYVVHFHVNIQKWAVLPTQNWNF